MVISDIVSSNYLLCFFVCCSQYEIIRKRRQINVVACLFEQKLNNLSITISFVITWQRHDRVKFKSTEQHFKIKLSGTTRARALLQVWISRLLLFLRATPIVSKAMHSSPFSQFDLKLSIALLLFFVVCKENLTISPHSPSRPMLPCFKFCSNSCSFHGRMG